MKAALTATVLVLWSICATGQGTPPTSVQEPSLELKIELIRPAGFGYMVAVRVTNAGDAPVTLAANRPGSQRKLYHLSVQQWNDAIGWENADGCTDVAPYYTMTLAAKQSIVERVPIYDIPESRGACMGKIWGLHNRIRAVLDRTYENDAAFRQSPRGASTSAPVALPTSESEARPVSGGQGLKLRAMGNGLMLERNAGFRIYAANDGSEVSVWYGKFVSDREAKSAIKQWLKKYKVTTKEHTRDHDRIVAMLRVKSGEEQFLIIRRNELYYFLIRSVSFSTAMQVDALIKASTTPF